MRIARLLSGLAVVGWGQVSLHAAEKAGIVAMVPAGPVETTGSVALFPREASGPMVRFVRLAASVVMVVGGVWLAVAFVGGPGENAGGSAPIAPAVEKPSVAALRSSRLIPDSAVSLPSDGVAEEPDPAMAEDLAAALASATVPEPAMPLPDVPAELAQRAPPLESDYHSALDLPPPPLLDAQSPPPLVGGSTWRQPQAPASLASLQPGRVPTNSPAAVSERHMPADAPESSVYVVCDGDDLTSIAIRFYGHPAAARLIYEANRDRLPAADVLPIGVVLALPPASGPQQLYRPGGWIEPANE